MKLDQEATEQVIRDIEAKQQEALETRETVTPKQTYTSWLVPAQAAITKATRENDGNLAIPREAIPPDVFAKWEEDNPGKVWQELPLFQQQKILMESMARFQVPDGKGGYRGLTQDEAKKRTLEMYSNAERDLQTRPVEVNDCRRVPVTGRTGADTGP